MNPTPSPDAVGFSADEAVLLNLIRHTPGQASGYAFSLDQCRVFLRQHVAAEVARETAELRGVVLAHTTDLRGAAANMRANSIVAGLLPKTILELEVAASELEAAIAHKSSPPPPAS